MQFSIKAILIAIAVIALLLVLPLSGMFAFATFAIWVLVPAALVSVGLRGNEAQRMFAAAAGATYLAICLQNAFVPFDGMISFGFSLGLVALGGVVGVQLPRRL